MLNHSGNGQLIESADW